MESMVSIVIPVYNCGEYLPRCVNSLTEQTYGNLEIILVDDGSTDSTPEICDRLAASDSRVAVVHKANGGVSSARNAGIEAAKGEFIAFADADEDAVPTGEIELTVGPDGETKTFYYYENFDDLLPADQTVDGFCKALAGYWGYGGYRLADRGDPVYTEDYAACFASVDGSTRMLDVPWDMSGRCSLAVYFDGDAEGAPVYIEIMQYPGYVGMDVGIRHPVG